MATTVAYRFVVKRDTAANFTAANTLLLQGEFGLETDTTLAKMGDGVTAWNSLLYWGGPISALLDQQFGDAQGSILYRDSGQWKALAPGTTGDVLQTNGAGANPTWAAVVGGGSGTALSAEILADSPIAFWKGDDASTKLADSSGNGFDLTTVTGTPNYRFGSLVPSLPTTLFANASAISGIASANSWQLTSALGRTLPFTNWTLEFTSVIYGVTARIFDWRTSSTASVLTMYPLSSGQWNLDLNNTNNQITGLASPPGKVSHLVVTCSTTGTTSTINTYQNGIPIGVVTATASTASGGTSIVSIGGGTYGGTTQGFTFGYAALFSGVLSAARIAAHAAAAGLLGS